MKYKFFSIPSYSDIKITRIHSIFERTESGKSWKAKPRETTANEITTEEYTNYVRSVDFMNGFFGGTCRAEKNYTYCGYIPVKITLVNPSRTEKHVEYFKFEKIML